MVFAYYQRLSAARKRVYEKSDAIAHVPLGDTAPFAPIVGALESALAAAHRDDAEAACNALCAQVVSALRRPGVRVRVLAQRPSHDWGELHGLYEPAGGGKRARITVWMRTARHRRVVAPRTFLRTLLHELCHHLDYEHFELAESFHTQGFYRRESSLFRQITRGRSVARRTPAAQAPRAVRGDAKRALRTIRSLLR